MKVLLILFSLLGCKLLAQTKFSVSGILYDKDTKETIPLVPIFFDSLGQLGTNTNLDGEYQIFLPPGTYYLQIRYSGYKILKDTLIVNQNIRKDFFLEPITYQIEEVVITAKDNPGLRVIKQAIKHKKENNWDKFKSIEYKAYNKLVISLNNISGDKLDKLQYKPLKKFIKAHENDTTIQDTLPNKYKLAIFISESISRVYQKKPGKVREVIEATQTSGVQNPEANLLSNFVTNLNFYENYISLVGKLFISPIADGATLNYKYELKGIEAHDQDTTYFIEVIPRNKFDLAFKGMIHIQNKSWAIKRLDLKLSSDPNVNFVEDIRIRQQFDYIQGHWLPVVSDIEVDFKNKENNVGLIGRTATTMTDYILDQPQPDKFFQDASVEVLQGATEKDTTYWKENRLSTLEQSEILGFALIDTLKTQSFWKIINFVSEYITNGRRKFKYFEIGNYTQLITFNAVEGLRNRIGIYTRPTLSKRWYFGAHIAYGYTDKRFKYDIDTRYKISYKPRFEIGIQRTQEIEQVGYPDYVQMGTGILTSTLFRVPLFQQNYFTENNIRLWWDVRRGIFAYFILKTRYFEPSRTFAFSFFNCENQLVTTFQNTELSATLRFSFKENFLMKGGEKVYAGSKYPIFYVEGSYAFPNHLGRRFLNTPHDLNGDFRYKKLSCVITDYQPLGRFGYMNYTIQAGKIWGSAPYPLLNVFRGSQSYALDPMGTGLGAIVSLLGTNRSTLYDPVGFNLMYFYEFVADQWITAGFDHHLESFFLRKIPLIRKLKWKELWTFRLAYGSLTAQNLFINNTTAQTIKAPNQKPYMEIGIGIENIFKVLRLDYLWRINYLNPQAPDRIAKYRYNYGLRINMNLSF
jgi:hypothetical protein